MKKDETYSFKTNIPVNVNFQSGVVKEGDSQYGHWKMYKIQVEATDYILFPSKGLQERLDRLGELEGKMFNIGKFETDENKTYWEIKDPEGNEVPFKGENAPQRTTAPYNPQAGYQKQPPKDFKATMDYKESQITKMQDSKEESMRLFSSGRDAVLIVTNLYPELKEKPENPLLTKEDLIKEQVEKWRNYFYQNIYKMSKDEYENLNSPF